MSNVDEIIDVLNTMINSINLVQKRFDEINKADDFVFSQYGTTLLDAISMRLQPKSGDCRVCRIYKADVFPL